MCVTYSSGMGVPSANVTYCGNSSGGRMSYSSLAVSSSSPAGCHWSAWLNQTSKPVTGCVVVACRYWTTRMPSGPHSHSASAAAR